MLHIYVLGERPALELAVGLRCLRPGPAFPPGPTTPVSTCQGSTTAVGRGSSNIHMYGIYVKRKFSTIEHGPLPLESRLQPVV